MSQNAQVLTVIGTLPALLPGESVDVAPGLQDAAGNPLIANCVVVDNGIPWVVLPNGDVRFVNVGVNQLPPAPNASRYKISHDHSIQTQYPTPSGVAGIPQTLLTQVRGTLEAFRSSTSLFPAGVATFIEFPVINTIGIGGILELITQPAPQNFQVEASNRAIEIQVKVSCESAAVAEEIVQLQLFEATGGTLLVIAEGTSTVGEPVNLCIQHVVPSTNFGEQFQVRLLSAAGGATLASAKSASIIIKTLD